MGTLNQRVRRGGTPGSLSSLSPTRGLAWRRETESPRPAGGRRRGQISPSSSQLVIVGPRESGVRCFGEKSLSLGQAASGAGTGKKAIANTHLDPLF